MTLILKKAKRKTGFAEKKIEKLFQKFSGFLKYLIPKKRLESFKNPNVTQRKPRFYIFILAIVTFNDIKLSFYKTARSLYPLEIRPKSRILKSRRCEIFLQNFSYRRNHIYMGFKTNQYQSTPSVDFLLFVLADFACKRRKT